MPRPTLQSQMAELRAELNIVRADRDKAVLDVTRMRAIVAVLKAALAQAEADER